jgi:hypothetical protein
MTTRELPPHRCRELGRQPSVLGQAIEQLAVGLRLPQTFVRHDMRCHVEGCLDGDLERVQHKPRLADVAEDLRRARERPELLDARLDERELLSEKVEVGHRVGTGRRR